MYSKQNLIDNYKDKVLAIESFGQNNKIYYDKFIQKDDLLHLLYELNCHEISLTDDGLSFIREYHGLEEVVNMVLTEIRNGVDYKYQSKDGIMEWLKLKGTIIPGSVVVNET